ncbi:MAG: TerB family tellurite resistance protein [Phycisphaerales bacterium]
MNQLEQDAIATVCLMAAFADGRKDDAERGEIRRIVEHLGGGGDGGEGTSRGLSALYQDVLLGRVTLERAVAPLTSPQHKTLAYEMAVTVCDADGKASAEEKGFLDRLRVALSLDGAEATTTAAKADELMDLGLDTEPSPGVAAAAAAGGGALAAGASGAAAEKSRADEAEIDASITRYSILNAAIELLPQGLATAAIVPLQMKMVYRIGAKYGYTLSTGHIKDFLAMVGVGMTSQVLENYARKFLGGLGRKVLGKMGGAVVDQATSSAFSFASTYALGHAAKAYYAGGRSLRAIDLKGLFTAQAEKAKGLYAQHRGAIEQQSRGLDTGKLLDLVRRGA